MPRILNRLTRQLRSRGVKNAKSSAAGLLTKFGLLKGGKLTAKGKKRDSMSPAERAKDRASKRSKHKSSAYKYSKQTNRATLKRK